MVINLYQTATLSIVLALIATSTPAIRFVDSIKFISGISISKMIIVASAIHGEADRTEVCSIFTSITSVQRQGHRACAHS